MPNSTPPLHPIEASPLHARRERVFLILAAIFLGSLTMLNVLGVSRFMVLFSLIRPEEGGWSILWGEWGSSGRDIAFALAVGVLPYPITFLCTDLISEFYGRKRANWVVFAGLMLNVWVMFILWLGGVMPAQPEMDKETGLPVVRIVEKQAAKADADSEASAVTANTEEEEEEEERFFRGAKGDYENLTVDIPPDYAFYRIRQLAFGAVLASMIAYLAAQFCDVWLFHFWKKLTRGKHLWLRNNGSTLISQLVDTVAVILITHFMAKGLPISADLSGGALWQVLFLTFILPGYVFKVVVALLDTLPFYGLVHWLKGYLEFDPMTEH